MSSNRQPPAGQSLVIAGRFAAATRVLQDAIAQRAFPGCAFGVLVGGKVVLEGALGRFTYDEDAPSVAPETVYDVASLTKVVATTAAAMILVQRGQLDLETPLGELLPAFVAGRLPADLARTITLRHLLAHNSGLPGYVEFFRNATTPEALFHACLELCLEAAPGTRAEYSDPGFILVGEALEAITREDLASWTRREIFEPLGMTATGFCPVPANRPAIPPTEQDSTFRHRRIQGEVQDENAWVLRGVAGHAGLFSNVPDLLRFAAAILGSPEPHNTTLREERDRPEHEDSGFPGPQMRGTRGTQSNAQFADPGQTSSLFDPSVLDRFSQRQPPPGSSRAVGWDTPSEHSSSGKYFSRNSIGHLGYSGCSLWIDRDAALAVVLLTNRTWPDRKSQLIREVRPAFHDAVHKSI